MEVTGLALFPRGAGLLIAAGFFTLLIFLSIEPSLWITIIGMILTCHP